jgi:predicted DNA-binding transcriptional regulator YafY
VSISRKEAFSFGLARKLLAHYEGTPLHLDMKAVLEGEVTLEPDWLSDHVDVLPEDRVRIDPDLWGRMVGFIERRETIKTRYQTFDGRESDYRLHPYHLLAYHGNWYLLAHNGEKDRMATFALSRFRQVEGTGETFRRAPDFNANAYAREAFGITRGERILRVRLLFEPKLAVYIMEREYYAVFLLFTVRDCREQGARLRQGCARHTAPDLRLDGIISPPDQDPGSALRQS